jgi:acyl carrier protein
VFLGAEALKPTLLKPLRDRYPQAQFTNLYGPTESTIFVTLKRLAEPEDFTTNLSNIGTVVPMMKAYVLDGHMNLLPIGITGELYVSGNGVGRGYINNPGLTAERFLKSPFDNGGTLYKTGDLVRLMPKGDIVYLGRADGQVKIRGFRIELGEIENALLSHPGIGEAVLTVFESAGGSSMLCAYYKSETEYTSKELTAYLAGLLPAYMIPSFFIRVDTFPMNRSGKIDKSKLPEPTVNSERRAPTAPRNQMEIKLLDIWRKVLGIDGISVADDFFFIGGDSLNALKVTALVGRYLEAEVSPRDLFRYRTVRALSAYIAGLTKTEYLPIPPVEKAPYYPLSSAQKRQFILSRIEGGVSYNQPGGLRIDGEIDAEKLSSAFVELIRRHESLRTSFELRDGEPVQIVSDSVDFTLERETGGEEEVEERMAAFVRPFELGRAPLLRVKLISFSPSKHVLLFDMHHIISDGTSVNIMVMDFVRL